MDPLPITFRDFADTAPSRAVSRPFVKDRWAPHLAIQQQRLASSENEPFLIPFEDCRISFAIDISQSTRGTVLTEECAFIQNFAEGLSPEAKEFVRVIPWDEISHRTITVEELAKIEPGGRTDPNVFLRNKEHIDLLQASHLWFLMTDGEIFPNTVRRFAFSINSRRLHGTACVIVVFGKRPAKPTLCNISVGVSVFAVTPNCLFIFHDVDTHVAYILQCKGCFNALLPEDLRKARLDNTTEWLNIPRLDYPDLFEIKVPAPTKLDINQFQLRSGGKVDLEDLYQGKVSKVVEDEILYDDDNLKSVILIATTRGQNRDIHEWISTRRDTFAGLVNIPREDINGKATALVKEAIEALRVRERNTKKFDNKKAIELRQIHALNWRTFKDSVESRSQKAVQKNTVVDDSLARLSLIERLGPISAECITPISPGGFQPGGYKPGGSQIMNHGPCSNLLWPRGYLLEGNEFEERPIAKCRLCRSTQNYFAIMLKNPPDGNSTPGFPTTHTRAGILYPFALGNFRETDIVSRLVCCPSCSVLAVEYGNSPDEEHLVGALVFGARLLATNSINRKTWISNIEKALDQRFSQECLLQILLAVMYCAKDQALITDHILAGALDVACKLVQADLQIPYEAGNYHWTGRVNDVVLHYLSIGMASPGCDFLNHPVDSFVLIIRMALNVETKQKTLALFYRLILHIIEHNHAMQDTEYGLVATNFYGQLRSRLSKERYSSKIASGVPPHSSLGRSASQSSQPSFAETLLDRHLVDGEALRIFRGAADLFERIERDCEQAIHLFICLFYAINTAFETPRQILHWFYTKPEMNSFFLTPWNIHDSESRAIWESLT